MGLSPGWADLYSWEQDGNYVEFGTNGDGRYLVRSTADALHNILESDETDNSAYAYLEITGTTIRVLERGRGFSPWDPHKVVVHDGHQGPKEIGVNEEFLAWLTDPVQNGGGAVTDFGCYGANLLTWLTGGQRPLTVTAVLQQFKPDVYPQVDDEATILVEYPGAQGIIQASWNWPFNRKDMEVYGATGSVIAVDRATLRVRLPGDERERTEVLPERESPHDDPFATLAAVVRGQLKPEPHDLSSLENNLLVVEILDAAKESARTGRRVALP